MPYNSRDVEDILQRLPSGNLTRLLKDGGAFIGDPWDGFILDERNELGAGSQGVIHLVRVCWINYDTEELESRICVAKILNENQFQRARNRLLRNTDNDDNDDNDENDIPFAAHAAITEEDETSTDHNVLKLITVVEYRPGQYCAILPYCELFLNKFLPKLEAARNQHPGVHAAAILHILSNTLEALNHIHNTKNRVHGDLNPANIALHNGRWCALDWDCSAPIGSKVGVYRGTPYFMHPICFDDIDYLSHPCNDLCALGVVLQLLLGKRSLGDDHQGLRAQTAEKIRQYQQIMQTPFLLAGAQAEGFYDELTAKPMAIVLSRLAEQMCNCQPSLVDQGVMNGLINFVDKMWVRIVADAGGGQQLDNILKRFYAEIVELEGDEEQDRNPASPLSSLLSTPGFFPSSSVSSSSVPLFSRSVMGASAGMGAVATADGNSSPGGGALGASSFFSASGVSDQQERGSRNSIELAARSNGQRRRP